MKSVAGLVILVASLQPFTVRCGGDKDSATGTAVSTTPAPTGFHVPCPCPKIYRPVCGSDGKTYSNECILRCISDYNVEHGLPAIHIKKHGECPRPSCNCPKLRDPVCGTDGHTYPNKCYFNCENARRKLLELPLIRIDYKGFCKKPVCCCPDTHIPVCGSNNLTYKNICILNCVSRYNVAHGKKAVHFKHKGPCKKDNCCCAPVRAPVCASDGKTYLNNCVLSCKNRRRQHLGLSPLKVQYKGNCHSTVACPTVYDPVCANNGVTFGNACILGLENRRRASQRPPLTPLKIKSKGVCPCACPYNYDPVCASDKKTYPNRCVFNCENKRRRDLGLSRLTIRHKGQCRCRCKHCSQRYRPVCGTDGRTYTNQCWLDCNRLCHDSSLHVAHKGPCGHCH